MRSSQKTSGSSTRSTSTSTGTRRRTNVRLNGRKPSVRGCSSYILTSSLNRLTLLSASLLDWTMSHMRMPSWTRRSTSSRDATFYFYDGASIEPHLVTIEEDCPDDIVLKL